MAYGAAEDLSTNENRRFLLRIQLEFDPKNWGGLFVRTYVSSLEVAIFNEIFPIDFS